MKSLDYVCNYPKKVLSKFTNSLGVSVGFLPIASTMETAAAGMSDWVSIQSRLYAAGFSTLLIPAIVDLRNNSRKMFNAIEGTRQKVHDSLYFLTISGTYKVGAYVLAGETDWKKIAIGTALTSVTAATLAPPLLKIGDAFEHSFNKTDHTIRKSARKLASSVLVASTLITSSVYLHEWPRQQEIQSKQSIEMIVNE